VTKYDILRRLGNMIHDKKTRPRDRLALLVAAVCVTKRSPTDLSGLAAILERGDNGRITTR
jgi:hypothetical protein